MSQKEVLFASNEKKKSRTMHLYI